MPAPTPVVSVLLPVRNGSATLAAAVESVRRQTVADWEIVAVDDGSDDDTRDVLRSLADSDSRIRPVFCPPRGIVPALNTAIEVSRAPLLARMDADDICLPTRFERQLEHLSDHAETGLVSCLVEFGGDRSQQAGYAAFVDWINSLVGPHAIALNRFVESPLAHPSVMFRRCCLEDGGSYRDGCFPEDYELWLRWLECGVRMEKVPAPLLVWNDPPDRLSRTDQRYAMRAFYQCKAEYLARWLATNNPHHPDVHVWGAGRLTRKRAEMLTEHGVRIVAYIDIDPKSIGQVIHGRPVLSSENLPPPENAFVVSYVGSRGARDDIRQRLCDKGYRDGRDCIMAA